VIFTWQKLLGFFGAVALLAWVLYPNEYFLGLMHRQEPDRKISVRYYMDFLDRNPNHKGATRALVKAYEDLADPDAGVVALRTLYDHRRGDENIGRELIALFERSGRLDEADKMRWTLFDDIEDRPGLHDRAREWLAYGSLQRAKLVQDDAGELRALEALADLSGSRSSYRWALWTFHVSRENYLQALALAEEDMRDAPDDPEARGRVIDIHRARKAHKEALASVDEALERFPKHEGLLNRRISVRVARKEYAQSLPDLERLIALQPEKTSYRRVRALNTLRAGREDEAVALYREEVARSGKASGPWKELTAVLIELERRREAEQELGRYLARYPDDREALDALVEQFDRLGEKERAAQALEEHIARQPDDFDRLERLANRYGKLGMSEKAAAAFDKLIAAQPDEKGYWWDVVYLFANRNLHEAAAHRVRLLAERFPDDQEAVEMIVHLDELRGRKFDAIAPLRAYVKRHPEDTGRVRALAALLVEYSRERQRERSTAR